ncbi:MAG: hypothetical protein KGL39_40800 [Patescibacteria group bacterium]|nr:hypothetical protein [Patescibacteria group bacterium]
MLNLPYLPLYRLRITSADPGFRLVDFGRRLNGALTEADAINAVGGGLVATVEAYDRHTGATLRELYQAA